MLWKAIYDRSHVYAAIGPRSMRAYGEVYRPAVEVLAEAARASGSSNRWVGLVAVTRVPDDGVGIAYSRYTMSGASSPELGYAGLVRDGDVIYSSSSVCRHGAEGLQ
jgi:hypothetical protein